MPRQRTDRRLPAGRVFSKCRRRWSSRKRHGRENALGPPAQRRRDASRSRHILRLTGSRDTATRATKQYQTHTARPRHGRFLFHAARPLSKPNTSAAVASCRYARPEIPPRTLHSSLVSRDKQDSTPHSNQLAFRFLLYVFFFFYLSNY